MLSRLLSVSLLAFAVFHQHSAIAQIATTPPIQLIEAPLDRKRNEQPIQLQNLSITSEVVGSLAQTTVEMVFFNPNRRNLEGNLQFPLQDGQQISAFALDIEGSLRPAVPVEKARGQQIFESIQREGIDPGLLEMTAGNHFKLRISPIPAMGTRRVQIKYTEALKRVGKEWQVRLPLAYGERWQNFELKLLLRNLSSAPKLHSNLRELQFQARGTDYSAQWKKTDFIAKGEVNLSFMASNSPQIALQKYADETYFVAEIALSSARSPRALPRRIGLLWDSSGSASKRDMNAELQELNTYFKAIGNAQVSLTLLREQAQEVGQFNVVQGNWDSLKAALQKAAQDGASALSAWQPNAQIEEYLLVSDGLSNFGKGAFPRLAKHQRLYSMSSANAADTSRLAAWAQDNRGKLVQITPNKPGSAAQALLTEGARLEQIEVIGASDVVFAEREPESGLLRLAGKLNAAQAQLNLHVSQQGKTSVQRLNLANTATPHPFAANLWAQYKLQSLQGDSEIHRAEIKRIGQHFAIPTQETSLLVLERLEDYVRHEVTPPPQLQAAVAQLQLQARAKKVESRQQQLDKVAKLLQEKVTWWEKDFPKTAMPQVISVAKKGQEESARRESTRDTASAPRPAARMALAYAPAGAAPPPPPSAEAGPAQANSFAITLKKWTANAPYMQRLRAAKPDQAYAIYLDEKPSYQNSSAFFLDVADFFFEQKQAELGLRVLSNLAEMDLENRALLRILGYRLLQAEQVSLALPVFEKVLRLAPEEPQSLRDLALALAQDKQYQASLTLFNQILETKWDSRFPNIETIVLADMNALIANAPVKLDTSAIDARLLKNLPLDLRVIMTWDADNTDMDLWVTDPNGERCMYSFPLTYQGGRMSNDFTRGYGPEEFSLKTAKPGKYKVEANYYGNSQQILAGATTLQVKLTTNFGKAKQQEQIITLRLKDAKETVLVGEFEVRP